MKKILSMMLVVMLVLSSIVAVNATESFQVIEVSGDATHLFGETFDDYLVLSADVYVANDVSEATIAAVYNEAVVKEVSIDTNKKNVWQNVKVELTPGSPADGLKFTSVGGSIYVNNINVGKAKAKTLVYEENFDSYADGANISGYKVYEYPGYDDNSIDANPVTSFKAAKTIDGHDGVATLFHPNYYYAEEDENGAFIGVQRFDNVGTPDSNATKYDMVSGKFDTNKDAEAYIIDIPEVGDADHVILEFDAYNAANAFSPGRSYDPSKINSIMDTLIVAVGRDDVSHYGHTEMPRVKLQAASFSMGARTTTGASTEPSTSHTGGAQSWNKVVIDARKSSCDCKTGCIKVDYTVEYCGKKAKQTVHHAYAKNFKQVIFAIDNKAGGRYYIDNVKYFVVNDIDDSVYVSRYSENFDKYDAGATPEGYTLVDGKNDTTRDHSTFTVAEDKAVSDSKYGRIYNKGWTNLSGNTRYLDDGTEDTGKAWAADSDTNSNREWFSIPLPGAMAEPGWGETPSAGDVKKTKLTFKHYITKSVQDGSGNSGESLEIGFAEKGNLTLNGTTVSAPYPTTDAPSVRLFPRGVYMNTNASVYPGYTDKQWAPTTIEIISTCVSNEAGVIKYSHDITYTAMEKTKSTTIAEGCDINNLLIGMSYERGGIAYIDDIEISTSFVASDVEDLDIATVDLYEAGVELEEQTDDFVVKSVDFSEDAQSITMTKKLGAADTIQVVTALYKDNVLEEAKVNEVNTSGFKAFKDNEAELSELIKVQEVGNGYSYKVFVFNSTEGLKPLADMFIK